MATMLLTWANGDPEQEVSSAQEALRIVRRAYGRRAVGYDAGGSRVERGVEPDIRSGLVAFFWATEAESRDDDGSHAVAEVTTD